MNLDSAAENQNDLPESEQSPHSRSVGFMLLMAFESMVTFAIYFLFACSPAPNVNETHYLTKAKNYWNPEWCPDDLFLSSSDAHLIFYWTFGWVTLFFSLTATAWIGRIIVWAMTAIAWQRLSRSVLPIPLAGPTSAGVALTMISQLHMAGEWMIGGIEAKGFAFVFVIWAVGEIVRGNSARVWWLLGIASAFHVLVGGWSVLAAILAWSCYGKERLPIKQMWPHVLAGGVISLAGLIPAITLTMGSDPRVVDAANQVYTFGRLKHHLVFSDFESAFKFRHGCLVVSWIVIALGTVRIVTARRLNLFVLGTVLIALIGIGIDQIVLCRFVDLSLSGKLLRFYWFRMSDIMIPVGVTFSALAALWKLSTLHSSLSIRSLIVGTGYVVCVVVIFFELKLTHDVRLADPRPPADQRMVMKNPDHPEIATNNHRDWLKVCQWISENTEKDAGFITPRFQQSFKWYAGRREVYNIKDIPQDAAKIVEWTKRYESIYSPIEGSPFGMMSHSDDELIEMGKRYNARYLLVSRAFVMRGTKMGAPVFLEHVYPKKLSDNQYFVLKLKKRG